MNKFQLFIISRIQAAKAAKMLRPREIVEKRKSSHAVRHAIYLEHKAAGTLKEYEKLRALRRLVNRE